MRSLLAVIFGGLEIDRTDLALEAARKLSSFLSTVRLERPEEERTA